MFSPPRILALAAALALLIAAYSNHFQNSFHFDDFHTIQNNPHIRTLSNVAKFFTDAHTFSTLPTHQVYRPLLTTSLAIDYVRGGGQTQPFHVTTFGIYLAYLACIFALFLKIMRVSDPQGQIWFAAFFGTAIYALHPVSAETVNYIVQRADLLSTFGVVAGVALYAYKPQWRRWGLYLVPVVLALLCKPPALVFPAMLAAYIYLFEPRTGVIRAILPSIVICAAVALLLNSMTVGSFNPGGTSPALYRITQMYVVLFYFGSFFAPVHLTADTDWGVLEGIGDPRALAGAAFLVALATAIYITQKRNATKPIAFGLIWFVAALFPTSWMPLAEVANDHRMFFPFVGLTLSVTWGIWLLLRGALAKRPVQWAAAGAVCLLLVAEAKGTYDRNEVWRNEETLWLDVTRKSPTNGRGLMNYALTQMAKGDAKTALQYLEQARIYTPSYFLLEINLGIANGELGRHAEAESHFERAMMLEPRRYESYHYYGRWLHRQKRIQEAASKMQNAVNLNPAAIDARHLLMQIYSEQGNWEPLQALARETLQVVPADPTALRYLNSSRPGMTALERAEQTVKSSPTPENYLSLSLTYYQAARYEDCIRSAREALRLRPNYPEAYNNIAAGFNAMKRWSEGIAAADEALRLNPKYDLARNNRAWAMSQLQAKAR